MRPLRWLTPAAVAAGLWALPAVASANWTAGYTVSPPGSGVAQENNYNCGNMFGSVFGFGWDASNNYWVGWADTGLPGGAISIPAGATLVGGSLTGQVVEYNEIGYGGVAPAGQYSVGAGAGHGSANNAGNSPGCSNVDSWGGNIQAIWLPGNSGQAVPFNIPAYNVLNVFLNGFYRGAPYWPLFMSMGDSSGTAVWAQVAGSMTLSAQYAFTPGTPTVSQVLSGNGTQVTVSWSSNGNTSDISYVLQRETLGPSGVVQGWTTIYQGPATSFTTSGQSCGYGYVYRVAAAGQSAQTPWASSAEWDEYPCSVSVGGATTNSLTISWPAVTPGTDYILVWCASSSCTQQQYNVGTGVTSVTLTGLTPNTSYTVWACSSTNLWGCPVAAKWTYAAVPTLSPNNGAGGVPANAQPLTWSPNGNPPGTVYQVEQASYAPDGSATYTWIYTGTGTSVTAAQSPGGSYAYWVFAQSAGYGNALTAASNGVSTQVAGAPTWTATGPSSATLSWGPVYGMSAVGIQCQEPAGSPWTYVGQATGGATSYGLTGLQPNTAYVCAISAVASNQGIPWWQSTATVYTLANPPASVTLGSITQTSVTVSWSANGNPAGTQYDVALYACANTSSPAASSGWISATSWTATGLQPGTCYVVWAAARNGSGTTTAGVWSGQASTVPAAPSFTAATGGLGWSASSGRGYVILSWSPVPGATGYKVWVYDGAQYEAFDVGGATSWDSRQALIYPPDSALYPNVTKNSVPPPLFSHNAGGLNLRDLPGSLYCTPAGGGYYCGGAGGSPQNYWISVSAYNASGDSTMGQNPCVAGQCYTPTLPLQTDPSPPAVTAWSLNNGGPYTYSNTVPYSLQATEGTSGVAAYALSNDGSTWTTFPVAGCAVGQVAPCQSTLSASGNWTLLPGPGSKTVWVRVESAAGVWSAPQATAVYVNVDQATPTVNVTLNGGAASTGSTAVTVAVTVSDPAAQSGVTWQARYSTDGGQTWSAWQAEGTATSWTTPWTIPGGAPGQRTVLVQVQNSDQNLGQGGATIYYAPPGTGSGAGTVTAGSPVACTWPVNGQNVQARCVTQPQVNLSLSLPAGAVQMRASLDGVNWGQWLPVAGTLPVNLGSSPGLKTVWVQYQDAQGNVSADNSFNPGYYVLDPGPPVLQASWVGNASATDGGGHATLQLQASDPVGTPSQMTLTVTENGGQLYSGPFQNQIPLTLTGGGYQMVQVTLTDVAGNSTSQQLGIYVQ